MQKKSFFPIVLIVGAAIYYFSKLKVTGDNLKVNLVNITTKKSSGLNLPKVILVFQLQNVTNNALSLNAIVGDIYINGSYFANVSNLRPMTIQPKSTSYLDVELQTGVLDVLPIIKDLIVKTGKRNLKVTGNLTLNVNGILVPLKIEKTIL